MSSVHLFHNLVEMSKHHAPPGFPERPIRLAGIEAEVRGALWDRCVDHLVTKPVDRAILVNEYGEAAIAHMETMCKVAGERTIFDERCNDIYWSAESMNAVRIAVQASLEATQTVLDAKARGSVEHAFAIVRPPGHHCFDLPAGFCIANNLGLAVKEALGRGHRVAIVDWDYHFGDGTAEMFLGDPNVMFTSLHCETDHRGVPTYPRSPLKGETLAERTGGRMFNIQWEEDDADNAAYLYAFDKAILPAYRKFDPTVVFISAGYDAIRGDTLAGMDLTPDVFAQLTARLKSLGVPIVCILEGGYNPKLLGRGVAHTISGLLEESVAEATLDYTPADKHAAIVDRVAASLRL
jgi:acetoin utilization deacetylase AcuC-like enzyme